MSNFINQCKTFIKGVRETIEIRRLQRRIQESRLQRYKNKRNRQCNPESASSSASSSENFPEDSSGDSSEIKFSGNRA